MSENKRRKKKFTIYSLFGKIGDILFIPIIIIALLSSLSMLSSSQKNKPVSVMGFSLVRIKSGSMVELGFGIGDAVFTKSATRDEIVLGDIIAFYNYHDTLDKETEKHIVIEYFYEGGKECNMSDENIVPAGASNSVDFSSTVKIAREGESTLDDATTRGVDVFFHQVIGIYIDDWGNVFYKTKGSHNSYHDGYVRSDFVLGKYVDTPRFVRDVINFCASTKGMILFVCLPLSVLVLMDCFSLIEQVELLKYEREILDGNIRLYDDNLKKNYDPYEMDEAGKAYVYYRTPPKEREKVKRLLWNKFYADDVKLSKKEEKYKKFVENVTKRLDVSNEDYWNSWLLETKGRLNKQIVKMYNSLEYEKLYNKIKDTDTN